MEGFKLTKVFILVTFLFDLTLHCGIVFGWNSIDQIIKHEGYFVSSTINVTDVSSNQSRISGQIFVLCIGLLGILLLLFGFVRDFVSFGMARILLYGNLIMSYLLMALATPTGCDNLMYAFVLQMGSGIGIMLNCLQYSFLFPSHQSLIVGMVNTCGAASSIIPQIWLLVITDTRITFTQLLIMWACLAAISLVFGIFYCPWHNLPDSREIGHDDLDALPALIKKKLSIMKVTNLIQQFRQSASFLKSPMFYVHLFLFALGNCMTTLMINVATDIMFNYSVENFEANLKMFEVLRVVVNVVWGPVIGFLTDAYGRCIKEKSRTDARLMLLPMMVNVIVYLLIVSMALFGADSAGSVWLMFFCLSIGLSNIYVFETLGKWFNWFQV